MAINKLPFPRQLALSFAKQWEDFGNTSSPELVELWTIIFHAKNILDSEGKPINIKLFNELNRDILQSLMLLLWNVNWIHTSISYGYNKIKAK